MLRCIFPHAKCTHFLKNNLFLKRKSVMGYSKWKRSNVHTNPSRDRWYWSRVAHTVTIARWRELRRTVKSDHYRRLFTAKGLCHCTDWSYIVTDVQYTLTMPSSRNSRDEIIHIMLFDSAAVPLSNSRASNIPRYFHGTDMHRYERIRRV